MIEILPSTLQGEIAIQPSKSYLHRLILCAALSHKRVTLRNVCFSDDVLATLEGAANLGLCDYQALPKGDVTILPAHRASAGVIDCKESGSTLRFLLPIALTRGTLVTFTGKGRLLQRPMGAYEALCREQNFMYHKTDNDLTVRGSLTAGTYRIPADVSSQFITGLLLALAGEEGTSNVILTGRVASASYLQITFHVLSWFGVSCHLAGDTITLKGGLRPLRDTFEAPGDWSHGAVYAAMGALCQGITLKGLDEVSPQGDRAILDILSRMGAAYERRGEDIWVPKGRLLATQVDLQDCPDLAPILAVLMAGAKGESRMLHAGRLREKECDRFAAIVENLRALGCPATAEDEDTLLIPGVGRLLGGQVRAFHDHRIAMSMAAASCICEKPVVLDDPACVRKSAPGFWQEFAQLGGRYVCRG